MSALLITLQFPSVYRNPPEELVLGLTLIMVACFLGAEVFAWREERRRKKEAPQREQQLIEQTLKAYGAKNPPVLPDRDAPAGQVVAEESAVASRQPVIHATFIRFHLMPKSPWQPMVAEILKAAGRDEYEVECDVLYEIFLVNTTDNPVTVRAFLAEVKIDGEWRKAKMLDDLSDYQLREGDAPTGPRRDLVSLAKAVENVPLARGSGYRGWLRFEFTADHRQLDGKKVDTRLWVVDALAGRHGVLEDEPLDTSAGVLVHNPSKDL